MENFQGKHIIFSNLPDDTSVPLCRVPAQQKTFTHRGVYYSAKQPDNVVLMDGVPAVITVFQKKKKYVFRSFLNLLLFLTIASRQLLFTFSIVLICKKQQRGDLLMILIQKEFLCL